MVELLSQGGVYLAKLNPTKQGEVGKVRPVVVLTHQRLLDIQPAVVFICPLSSQSHANYDALHLALSPRDNLRVISFALIEHCRAIAYHRLTGSRLAQLSPQELEVIRAKLLRMIS